MSFLLIENTDDFNYINELSLWTPESYSSLSIPQQIRIANAIDRLGNKCAYILLY